MKKSLNSLVTIIIFLFSTSAMTTPIQWGNTGHWYEFIDTNVMSTKHFLSPAVHHLTVWKGILRPSQVQVKIGLYQIILREDLLLG
ncbi:hypothetical protein C8R34_11473 [Nitrosomonas sp. Nm84]|uniref:hypothetical protein n=1 Tax=Nitrosomonas sp. Nm84 TaxID=200124 RepID=UPI000D91F4E2|nr:hypothetical protein [Nitrosomonas sp. Nm84]PXW86467.1 hypothetical protein C8R34_11473 [Nitrosomonas sp. Nm84]